MKHVVVIGGSAGSFKIVSELLSRLPKSFKTPVIICLHRLRSARRGFLEALAINTSVELREPFDKERLEAGKIYLAPANYHLMIDYGYRFNLSVDRAVNHSRPSIDVTMDTAAEIFKDKTIGVLLSGANMDGSAGMHSIHKKGGITIAQNPEDAEIKTMPESAINLFKPNYILDKQGIISHIINLD